MRFFAGKTRVKPGAYSLVDLSQLVRASGEATKVIALVGTADGGTPKTPMVFTSPSVARQVLRGGDLLKASQLAWKPSLTLPGASIIVCIRVNPATQAVHTLQASAEENAIRLTSIDYGTRTFSAKVGSGTGGGIVLSLTDGVVTEHSPELNSNTALVTWVNENSQLCTAELLAGTTIVPTANWVAFTTAGTNPAPLATDWQGAIDALASERVDAIVPLTADETIHGYCKGHVIEMSSARRERRMFVGSAEGETVQQILNRAGSLAHSRATLCASGIKVADGMGVESLPPIFCASLVAGLWAGRGNSPEPLTFDFVNVLGLTKVYNEDEIESLLYGGVLVIEQVIGEGYRIVQALTTHLWNSINPSLRELSVSTLVDMVISDLRNHLERRFVGKAGTSGTEASIYNATISRLNQYIRNGWLVDYADVSAHREGTMNFVEFRGSIVEPNNYVFITSHF